MIRPISRLLPFSRTCSTRRCEIGKPLSVGFLLILLTLTACASSQTGAPSEGTPPDTAPAAGATQNDGNLSPDNAAEAAAREELQAQMEQVESVVQTLDRSELIAESATKGRLDAPVILLKFSDFQCPYCAIASSEMKDFTQARGEDVLYVYKQFPLVSIHDEAMPAAKASWAAGQQDKFWIYHDGLFAFQDKLGEDYYLELAEQVGLNIDQFNKDRNSPEAETAIQKDIALAEKLGLKGTPSFVMNDIFIPGGVPLEFFEAAADRLKADAIEPGT